MASDRSSIPNKIPLTLTEGALDSGITGIFIEDKLYVLVVIRLSELDSDTLTVREKIDHKNFPQMIQKLMRNAKSMVATKISDKRTIDEIGYQIATTLNENQNYALFKELAEKELEKSAMGRVSDAKMVVDLALDQENTELLFKNQYEQPYAAVRMGNDKHLEIISLESSRYHGHLTNMFYERYGRLIGKDSLSRAINLLRAKTIFDDKTIPLHVRAAWGKSVNRARPDCIYIDMTDSHGAMIEVSPNDWRMINGNESNVPILFQRHNQTPQSEPDRKYPSLILDRFLDLTNVTNESHRQLLKVYIVSLLVPDIDHVILTTYGPKGAAKTFLLWLIKMLIDPSKPVLLSLLRDMSEFTQQLNHNYLAFYDNVKFIPYWLSDEICKAVTGIGHTKRKLYSNDDDFIYEHRRCIAINGIDVALTEPDAMDRSLYIKLEEIGENNVKIKEDLIQEFEKIKPQVLGLILDVLVKAMKIKPTLKLTRLSRMAGFTAWGEAISRALGYQEMSFVQAYFENRNEQNIVAVEENLVGKILVKFYEDYEKSNIDGLEFVGSPEELYKELVNYANQNDIIINSRQFPKAANILVKKINAVRPNLKEAYDIIVDISRDKDNNSVITISRRKISLEIKRVSKTNVINNYYEQIVHRQHIQNYENFTSRTPNVAKVTSGTSELPPDFSNLTKKSGGTEVPEVNSEILGSKIQPDKTEPSESREAGDCNEQ